MSTTASAMDPDARRPPRQAPKADGDPDTSPVDTEARTPDEIVPETQPEEEDDLQAERNESSKLAADDRTPQNEGLDPSLDGRKASKVAPNGPPPTRTDEAPPVAVETHDRPEQSTE
ncbi:hypothetical protein PR003_g29877 [Phytophthora rubi]|uniref:Uncharacterized protein n=1 Tax=Phytophthora rubi TaxID=129364 RepID=A0A6A4BE87_9STRA|nr:hypothetical protein PR003_g29877 [Phytophthora rubi]